MTYQEVRNAAKGHTGLCKACPVCNGVACSSVIPGPGSKDSGKSAKRNYDAWQEIYLNMDTISQEREIDTSFDLSVYGTATTGITQLVKSHPVIN